MSELARGLKYLFPDLERHEVAITVDGQGERVTYWGRAEALPEDVLILEAARLSREEQAAGQQVAVRLRAAASPAVGVASVSLTAAQVRALLAVLLEERGALDAEGRVRPLEEWR